MEQSQAQGYITEVEYIDNYYTNLEPVLLSYIAGINGLKQKAALNNYNYCELGCGNGLSLNLFADANRDSQFYGVDFNSEHIEHAQKQAELAELDNVHYLQESFADMLDIDLPEFDFITLHGVYSWISPELRQNILNFIEKKLKPGGLVMVSYNTLPGWSTFMPLREMMRTYTNTMDVDVIEKAKHGIAYLDFLNKKGAPFFKQNPKAGAMVESLKTRDMRYIVHEFFNEHWNPLYFSQVNNEMHTASLTFAGSAEIPLNYSDMSFPPAFKDEIAKITVRTSLEIHRSFINNERFRRDVYFKPTGKTQEEAADNFLFMDDFSYTSLLGEEHFQYHAKLITGSLQLDGELFKPLVQELYKQIHTIDSLSQADSLKIFTREEIYIGIQRLMTTGQIKTGIKGKEILPVGTNESTGLQFQSKFNQLNYEQYDKSQAQRFFVSSPVLGGGIHLDTWNMMAIEALKHGTAEQGVDMLLQDFRTRNKVAVDRKGDLLADREAEKAFLMSEVEMFEKFSVPVLKRLGVFKTQQKDE